MVNQNPVDRSRQRDSPRIAAYQAVVEIHQPSHPNPPGSPEPREPAPESCPQCPSLRRVFRDPFSRRTLWTTFLHEKIRSSTSYHSPTSYGKNIILSLDQQTAIATSEVIPITGMPCGRILPVSNTVALWRGRRNYFNCYAISLPKPLTGAASKFLNTALPLIVIKWAISLIRPPIRSCVLMHGGCGESSMSWHSKRVAHAS